MKRIIVFLLCTCLTMSLFSGCSSEDTPYVPTGNGLTWEDDTVVIPTGTEPEQERDVAMAYYPNESMNPYLSTDFTNRTLFPLLYQGLFTVDRNYNIFPMLCKRYTVSKDMRTYTLYLENATFSDGSLVTASDVLASYQAAMAGPVYSGRFRHVEEILLSGDGGVIFKLETSYENFPLLLDVPIVKAADVNADRPLGSGPYFLEQTTAGLRLRRRSNWWCRAELSLSASSIALTVAESPAQIRDEFQFGNVGIVCADPGSDSYADYRSDYELWDCENGDFLYMGCNTASPLFSDTAVRSALTYAIDRDALVAKYYRGFAHSATLPASPVSPYYNAQLAARYTYDSDRFTQAVSTAGLTGATVRVLVNKNDTLRLRTARAIGQMLVQCGLVLQMVETTGEDYLYLLANGEYDLYVGQTRLSPNMDLSAFFVKSSAFRYGGMTDAATYAMCLEALANRGNYYNLHQMIMQDGRLCPVLFQSYSIHATRGVLTNLTPARDNIFFYTLGKTMEDALS